MTAGPFTGLGKRTIRRNRDNTRLHPDSGTPDGSGESARTVRMEKTMVIPRREETTGEPPEFGDNPGLFQSKGGFRRYGGGMRRKGGSGTISEIFYNKYNTAKNGKSKSENSFFSKKTAHAGLERIRIILSAENNDREQKKTTPVSRRRPNYN